MKVHAPDGSKWRVRQRILPWRPRAPWLFTRFFGELDLDFEHPILTGILLLAIVLPFALYWLVKVLLALACAPIIALGQRFGWWRPRVVAYRLDRDTAITWRRAPRDLAEARRVAGLAARYLTRPCRPGASMDQRPAPL